MGAAAIGQQRGIGGCGLVRVEGLQRVDQHAGDVAPCAQHMKGAIGHLGQSVGLVGGGRVASPWLHIAPPAVVSTAEPHEVGAPRVVSGQTHSLHDRLGAGHVERHFIQAGDFPQTRNIGGDQRVIRPQHRAGLAHPLPASFDAGAVKIMAKKVNPVGSGHIVVFVPVEVGQHNSRRALQEGIWGKLLADHFAVRERHTVTVGELQVGDALAGRRRQILRRRGSVAKAGCQSRKRGFATRCHLLRSPVGAEKPLSSEFVIRHPSSHAPRHFGVASQRRMLGRRKLEADHHFGQQRHSQHATRSGQRPKRGLLNHRPA